MYMPDHLLFMHDKIGTREVYRGDNSLDYKWLANTTTDTAQLCIVLEKMIEDHLLDYTCERPSIVTALKHMLDSRWVDIKSEVAEFGLLERQYSIDELPEVRNRNLPDTRFILVACKQHGITWIVL
jgi:hypothetical protein